MRIVQRRSTESSQRTATFMVANKAILGPLDTSPAGQQLTDAIARTGDLSAQQAVAERTLAGHGAVQKQLATIVREEHMGPVAKFSRGKLRGAPGYSALTKSGSNVRGTALVTAATAMATAAQPYLPDLVAAQFPPDTLDQLTAAATTLATAIADRTNAKQARIRLTAALQAEVRRAREAVAMLDPIITKKLAGQPGLLAEWRSAKRIPRSSTTTFAPATTPVTSTNSSPATAAASAAPAA